MENLLEISGLPHLGHMIVSFEVELFISLSKIILHLSHSNSYIGIELIPMARNKMGSGVYHPFLFQNANTPLIHF